MGINAHQGQYSFSWKKVYFGFGATVGINAHQGQYSFSLSSDFGHYKYRNAVSMPIRGNIHFHPSGNIINRGIRD